jgi:hypothetical protein
MKYQRNRQHPRECRLSRFFPGRLIGRPQLEFSRSESGSNPRSRRLGAHLWVRAKCRQTRLSPQWQDRRLRGRRASPTHRSLEHLLSRSTPQHRGLLFRGPMLGTRCRRSTVMSIPYTSTGGQKAKVSQRHHPRSTCKRRAGAEQVPR